MRSEAEAREQLAAALKRLEKFEATYGVDTSFSPDVQRLSVQLAQKQGEIQTLQLQETQRAQMETSLYSELERLSAAWEALDREVRNKVFDLAAMEDRLTRTNLDVR